MVKKGITLDITDEGEVEIAPLVKEESIENGFTCYPWGQICEYCQHIPEPEDWLPPTAICTASSNPQRVFDIQKCPQHNWYIGKPPKPRTEEDKE